MEAWLLLAGVVVSSLAGISTALIANRAANRAGLPTDLDARLMAEYKEWNTVLEKNNTALEAEVRALQGQVDVLTAAKTACEERLDSTEARVNRLLRRLGESPDA